MQSKVFEMIENHMKALMGDSAHDCHHIYRVLYAAVDIAEHEDVVDMDVLIAACLLHDIGRAAQAKDPSVCHAQVGSEMAYTYLLQNGWEEQKAEHIRACINTHRFRGDNVPGSIEAKILFDADKLDVTGAMGIARTLIYKGQVEEPLYSVDDHGIPLDGSADEQASFFQEYHFKLKKLYDRFYTQRASQLAQSYRSAAQAYFQSIWDQVSHTYAGGKSKIDSYLCK